MYWKRSNIITFVEMNFIKIDFNKRIILFCNENVLDKK